MVNLMKAQRIMRYTRAKRVHLSEVRVVKKYRTLSSKPLKKFRHDEKLLYLCGAKPEERCRSGRSGRSRKPLYPYGYPGFESLSFRNLRRQKSAFKRQTADYQIVLRFFFVSNPFDSGLKSDQEKTQSDKVLALKWH